MQVIATNESYRLVLPEAMLPSNWDGALIYKLFDEYLGVAEFSAPPDSIVIPRALLEKHNIEIGQQVKVEQVQLPKGTSITLKSSDAIDWKHLLENYLPKHYTALKVGQELLVDYNGPKRAVVTSCEPEEAICIVDTDLDLELDIASTAQEPQPSTHKGKLQISGLGYVGPVGATSSESYFARVVDGIYEASGEVDVVGECIVTEQTSKSAPEAAASGSQCPICGKKVPATSMIPHQAFCARNTTKCECGAAFTGGIPSNHWHCECGHAETSDFKQSHDREHVPSECQCGFQGDFKNVALHRATDCPLKVILCRFCHLWQPQGTASAVDRLSGLSEHEAACGAKTVDCFTCHKIVLVRNLSAHMARHEQVRNDRALLVPSICANINCPNLVASPGKLPSDNTLGMCSHCFGLVYVPGTDPDHSKLRSRLERRYVLQLTRGCGNAWCANSECASGSGAPLDFKGALKRAAELETICLCVDKNTTRRNMFLDEEPEYSVEWKGMAISACGSEAEARAWLRSNAPKIPAEPAAVAAA